MVTKLYLVRHGESEGNVNEFFQGHMNTQLTEKGIKQVKCLAKRLKNLNIDKIYSSPLDRAINTAKLINTYHNKEIIINQDLIEINGGDFEGKKWAFLTKEFPDYIYKWKTELNRFEAPNGESMNEVYHRISTSITKIVKENIGKNILIVSHGCALRNFLCFVEYYDIKSLMNVGFSENSALSFVEYDNENNRFILKFKNDSSHLPDDLSSRNTLNLLINKKDKL